ncbi:MAG TPA: RNA polymerase sigma factor [Ktedonobacterales bacterium]|jgi:RNA polymerase sigma-70 factor, ECF subfamily|nr:RNA polymerase sigma factor [Ktedonobacterales bacterium]
MWSRSVISLRIPARSTARSWVRRDTAALGWMRALAPWLAALETDNDQSVSQARRSETHMRAAEEQAEFERFFTQYGAALLDYLYGMTRNHEAATDLMQETFLRAWASATPLAEIQQPKAWLYRIATNLALNQSRRQRRFVWLPLETVEPLGAAGSSDRWRIPPLASHVRSGDDVAASVVERDAIWETLAALPPRQQAALLLQTSGGFEPREIAVLLALSETNVRKMLFRAKERFRTVYRAMNAEDTGKRGRA